MTDLYLLVLQDQEQDEQLTTVSIEDDALRVTVKRPLTEFTSDVLVEELLLKQPIYAGHIYIVKIGEEISIISPDPIADEVGRINKIQKRFEEISLQS